MENKQIKQLSRTAFKEYEAKLEYMKNTRRLEDGPAYQRGPRFRRYQRERGI